MIGKLLIVDDEAWFRDGLMTFISNNQLGWEVIGEASDGEEAISLVDQYCPDLIITDIQMPIMDGLMLAKQIADRYPHIRVIILTGYREFEYAQQAIRYGAADFLLKPLSLPDTSVLLRSEYDSLKQRQLQQKLQAQQKTKQVFLSLLLACPVDKEDQVQFIEQYKNYLFTLLKVDSYMPSNRSYQEKDMEILHYAITNIIEELQQSYTAKGICVAVSSHEFALLLPAGYESRIFQTRVIEVINHTLGIDLKWQDGGKFSTSDQLSLQFSLMRIQNNAALTREIPWSSESPAFKEQFSADLIVGDIEAVLRKIKQCLELSKQQTIGESKLAIYAMMTALYSLMTNEFRYIREDEHDNWNVSELLRFNHFEQLEHWTLSRAESFLHLFKLSLTQKQDNLVEKAKQYIEQHYQESCTLQTVAAAVHVTPNYLSNLFKKETGIAFSNYINKFRIEKAKQLLAYSSLKMSDIAEQTGFDNQSYFTAVFKQWTLQSPSEYRKVHTL